MERKWRVKRMGAYWVAISPTQQVWTDRSWKQGEAFAFALDHATGAMR